MRSHLSILYSANGTVFSCTCHLNIIEWLERTAEEGTYELEAAVQLKKVHRN